MRQKESQRRSRKTLTLRNDISFWLLSLGGLQRIRYQNVSWSVVCLLYHVLPAGCLPFRSASLLLPLPLPQEASCLGIRTSACLFSRRSTWMKSLNGRIVSKQSDSICWLIKRTTVRRFGQTATRFSCRLQCSTFHICNSGMCRIIKLSAFRTKRNRRSATHLQEWCLFQQPGKAYLGVQGLVPCLSEATNHYISVLVQKGTSTTERLF